jgi:LDH2 family malate/lactate/ureidoglycolate dehydrogenase
MPTVSRQRVSIERLDAFCRQALAAIGMSEIDAKAVVDALATTDSMGVFTHGTKLLAGYVHRLQGGGYRVGGRPRIEREGPGWAVIDGDAALGQIGCDFSVRVAIAKAKSVGVAYVGLRNTGHIGAAGCFAAMAAREGCLAMVTGNDVPSVAAPGSRKAVLGSNPIAYGIPFLGHDPILLDMATAAVAGGKVYAAIQRGEEIPSTWLIDERGQPTADGRLYPHSASLAPMAGHKGYGLGLWAEILSGVLPGGAMTWGIGSWLFDEPSKPSLHNAGMVVIDVATIGGLDAFSQRLQTLVDEIHAAPTAEGVERVLLPGEKEWQNRRQAIEDGIPLPADVRAKLADVAKTCGIPELE